MFKIHEKKSAFASIEKHIALFVHIRELVYINTASTCEESCRSAHTTGRPSIIILENYSF